MIRRRLPRIAAAALAAGCAAALVAGCATTVSGTAVSVFDDPFHVAGMPTTDGPSGLRSDAEPPTREVTNTDGSDIDQLGAAAVSDIEQYWSQAYPEAFDDDFSTVEDVVSWDANDYDGYFCDTETYGIVNAAFCFEDNTIGWDRGELMPSLRNANGDMGVVMVLAHEYGHAVQYQARLNSPSTPTLVTEQQADCFAGSYMRWVAEGSSPRFTLSTGDGLNNVLASVIAFRDPVFNEGDAEAGMDEHGSAFERVSAFQFGFTDGPAACAAIDIREIGQRRGDLPVLLPEDQTGELPVSEESVRQIVDAMGALFAPPEPPTLSIAPSDCPDARDPSAVTFCPDTNTISVNMAELQAMGTPSSDGGLAVGDNSAYSVLMSRYMQAIQHEQGLELTSADAALRTACLTGVATAKLSRPVSTPDGNSITLTAGDVDEAVSGLLTNGVVASDVNGESVPSGFSRIDAFRLGVLGDSDRCIKRFR